ncbi:sugar phosphate isomerase/epimerase family protein [Candidatus Laterigemmans baculatus]|uniref:sugar phosphate isomerase/epimerase family protein n=1 Tax=Candidatus Laterigemmans baculatus TaxID=2770505 RepID=UPI0013D9FD6F|nr:TIM barrel protein [Candidatus Laterigemmans baculatus]
MYKNFSAPLLGISGRQSELIELALTYGFRGIDVDMTDMVKRSQRTDFEDASKYLRAAEIIVGGFNADINLDADDEKFKTQLATLHPLSDVASQLEAKRAFLNLPAGTDRMAYPEFFDQVRDRLNQIGEVLAAKEIKLGVAFSAAREAAEGKKFEFVRNVEGFVALLKSVSASNVGFVIDSWHWHVGGGTLEQLRELDPARVVAVRLAELPGDVSAAEAKAADREVPTVDGTIDQVSIVRWLAANTYKGPVVPSASAAKAKGQTRESIVNKAQEAIDAIFRAAGLSVDPRPMDLIQTMYADLGRDDDEARPTRPIRQGATSEDDDDNEEDNADADHESASSR